MLPNSTTLLPNSAISYTSNGVIVLDALFLDCMLLGCYFIASSGIKKTKTSQIIHCPKLFFFFLKCLWGITDKNQKKTISFKFCNPHKDFDTVGGRHLSILCFIWMNWKVVLRNLGSNFQDIPAQCYLSDPWIPVNGCNTLIHFWPMFLFYTP